MKTLNIAPIDFAPAIVQEGNLIRISGKSVLEDAATYFNPLHRWLDEYLQTEDSIRIEFNLAYFNSTTAKQILKFLMRVDDSGVSSEVTWKYPADNEILLERGQEFAIMLDLKIKFQAV